MTSAPQPLVDARDVNVWFDLPDGRELHAVRGADVRVNSREKLGIVGESGCGKSTLLMALMGLLPATASVSGRIEVMGADLLAGGERAFRAHRWKDLAIVFQGAMNALNPVIRVQRQIVEALELHEVASGMAAVHRASDLVRLVGLPEGVLRKFNHELSGGMRQRVSLAMALACDPRVLLADEPTTALDMMVAAQVLALIDRLTRELDLALVLVTHDLPLVTRTCDRIQVMYAGTVVESGTPADIYHQPQHPYTRLLFAATADVHSDGPDPVTILGAPPRLDQVVPGCAFEPRCPHSQARCATDVPQPQSAGKGRSWACHYPGEST
ncbi:ABC transporter ATP-binding protein [Planosporangium thailandense]|uniref:ABC transporter ATP-binding protein n=1 Tax=Planosporangium thailandense TaxID=765197 RepID=A0ABX0Y560_9ACTN|nr:ABC transporter ATP-binding protein [Planosporangium thailandense]NJC73241.1 ABC transporter ATP-binding protein [Planosporangium thailandense]